jgi:septation ring formation regulator EzrA
MKKTEVKEIQFQKDQYGMTMYPIDYSLSMIANMLSNFEHGISRLAVDNNITDETDLRGVENQLEQLQIGVSNVTATLEDIQSTSINTNNNLELIVMQLSRIADSLETKNK